MRLQTFADDIGVLGGVEGCDVIVDDVTYVTSPAFRDGPIATAVDAVSDLGVLYFSSSGNYGSGNRFTGVSLREGLHTSVKACICIL